MIHEVIITTKSSDGNIHIAPMGIKMNGEKIFISPFKPSKTLINLTSLGKAVVNFVDDVRIFAGIVSGSKKDWPLTDNKDFEVPRLEYANTHYEISVKSVLDDKTRPKIECTILNKEIHTPFLGFNRAQFSVIEASVLISRLNMLPIDKIENELEYLKIGLEKTSGEREKEAWEWIQKK